MENWQRYVLNPKGVTAKYPDERLLRCPFCGGVALLGYRPALSQFFVMCGDEGCSAYLAKQDNCGFATDVEAVAGWNKRKD